MIEHEVAVKLENHDQQIKSLKHRMDGQEKQDETMQELVVSVKLLAVNMENMLEAQKAQGERLEKLESEPGENWKNMKRTAISTIVSTLVGAIAGGLIILATLNYL